MSLANELIETTGQRIEKARGLYYKGELDPARQLLLENLQSDLSTDEQLETLNGIFYVEWKAGNLQLAHDYILRAKDVGKHSSNEEQLAAVHNNYGLILRSLAETTRDNSYFDKAILEYTAAAVYYELLGNFKYQARLENNLAYLHLKLGRYEQALNHAKKARELVENENDLTQLAYILDTTAQIYLEMNELETAFTFINKAAEFLPKGDEHIPWFDISSTYARILFRLKNHAEGKKILDDAVKLAEDLNQSKVVAQLTLLILENCEQILMPLEIVSLHQKIFPLISEEKDLARLAAVSNKFYLILNPEQREKINFSDAIDRIEKETIRRALINAKGSITHAAEFSGISYQRLQARLENRYLDLNKMRTPQKRRRRKSIIKRK